MIVVDTNVITYFFIMSTETDKAQAVMQKDANWIAPPLWKSEFRNVLIQHIKHERLTLDEAYALMAAAERLLKNHEYEVDSNNVLRLAESSKCSAYDCEFVALAKRFDLTLVTADKKVLREFPDTAVSLAQFTRS